MIRIGESVELLCAPIRRQDTFPVKRPSGRKATTDIGEWRGNLYSFPPRYLPPKQPYNNPDSNILRRTVDGKL